MKLRERSPRSRPARPPTPSSGPAGPVRWRAPHPQGAPLANRRTFRRRLAAALGGLAALVVAGPVTLAVTQGSASAVGPDLLPVTGTKNTGRGEAVYLYILRPGIPPGGPLGHLRAAGPLPPRP